MLIAGYNTVNNWFIDYDAIALHSIVQVSSLYCSRYQPIFFILLSTSNFFFLLSSHWLPTRIRNVFASIGYNKLNHDQTWCYPLASRPHIQVVSRL